MQGLDLNVYLWAGFELYDFNAFYSQIELKVRVYINIKKV